MKYEINDPRKIKSAENVEINYGDLFEWTTEHIVHPNPVMWIFGELVSLTQPDETWTTNIKNIREFLNKGELRKLPPGYSITIIQD